MEMMMMMAMQLIMMPIRSPLVRVDLCEDEEDVEGVDAAVLDAVDEGDVRVPVTELNTVASTQPCWQPYFTKQLLKIC
jgi:hypothetical protein